MDSRLGFYSEFKSDHMCRRGNSQAGRERQYKVLTAHPAERRRLKDMIEWVWCVCTRVFHCQDYLTTPSALVHEQFIATPTASYLESSGIHSQAGVTITLYNNRPWGAGDFPQPICAPHLIYSLCGSIELTTQRQWIRHRLRAEESLGDLCGGK